MHPMFGDILERAEKLQSNANLGDISRFPVHVTVSTPTKAVGEHSTLLDSGLVDIFRTSEDMWKRKNLTRVEAMPSAITNLKAGKDADRLSMTALAAAPSTARQNATSSTAADKDGSFDESALLATATSAPYDAYAKKKIDKYVERSFERARLEAERTFLGQQTLQQKPYASPFGIKQEPVLVGSPFAGGGPTSQQSSSTESTNRLQEIFANKIDNTLEKNCQASIVGALHEALNDAGSDEKEAQEIWEKAFAILSKPLIEEPENVHALRTSKKWFDHVIAASMDYLHRQFFEHTDVVVKNNRHIAKLGGQLTKLARLEAYLNVRRIPYIAPVEGGYYKSSKHPIWTLLFYCLRLGDIDNASEMANELAVIPNCAIIASAITKMKTPDGIDEETKAKLNAEWKQVSSKNPDRYKRAIYGIFLGFDCHDVNTTIEDWLWSRLFHCRLQTSHKFIESFKQLQSNISVECGEKYFIQRGGNYMLYYSALMLTGQIERAIEVFCQRPALLVHAVHIGILAYQLKLLVLCDKVSDDTLTVDYNDQTVCMLNLPRIVLLYVKKNFEESSFEHALNYSFFLNGFELDADIDGKGGRNIFESQVSRIVNLTGQTDEILGRLNSLGERLPGFIDRFSSVMDATQIISYVAADTEASGNPLLACNLYVLAGNDKEALTLICSQMSFQANNFDETAKKTVELAKWMARRYRTRGLPLMELPTLCALIDIRTLFERFRGHEYETVIGIVQQLKIVPLDLDDVQPAVAKFQGLADEVRALLPDMCLALMQSVVSVYETEPPASDVRQTLVEFGKAILQYVAMVPHHFPQSYKAQLMQYQSKIAE